MKLITNLKLDFHKLKIFALKPHTQAIKLKFQRIADNLKSLDLSSKIMANWLKVGTLIKILIYGK